jgi:hypothetical protein
MAAFLAGVDLSGVSNLNTAPPQGTGRDHSLAAPALLFTIGAIIMTAVGIAIVGPSTVFGLYHEWWDSKYLGADQRFVDTGLMLTGAGVYALLASDDPSARWRRWFAYTILAACLMIALSKGDRTAMVTIGVGAGWCFTQRVRRLRWTPVLVAAFIGIVAFPVIREWRAERSLEASKRASVGQLLGESVYSLGNAINAVILTVDLVPEHNPYGMGRTFRAAAVAAVPNLGLTKGASWKQKDVEDSPSAWLTWLVNPYWASTGGGYGFAMAAEWHYNFGLLGVLFGTVFTGFGVTRVRNACRRSSLALVWSATLFAGISIWLRNVVGFALKVAVWPVVGLWLIHRAMLLLRGRARSRPPAFGGTPAGSASP